MVSIPDWSRFRGLGDPRQAALTPEAKYRKQRADEAVKQAEECGYFLNASRSFLEGKYLPQKDETSKQKKYFREEEEEDGREANLDQVPMVKLPGAHLKSVGDVGLCTRLRICVLSSNYITRFDALVSCVNLFKLDLHSNQITMVPMAQFWSGMRQLRILHLHDNPLGRIENLHSLSACQKLILLSLYDTPLSLKRNYRHHVVNSIWTLKALDNYVISDEEIIEDADFGGKFSVLHPSFAIDLCPPTPQDCSYDEELHRLYQLLADINQIMANNSPVLIIQRHIRGYLLRKRYKLVLDMRICKPNDGAAVTIQRKFREWKGLDTPRNHLAPPPSSPNTSLSEAHQAPLPSQTPPPSHAPPPSSMDKLDYDTYMQIRRPGSSVGASESLSDKKKEDECSLPETPTNSAEGQRKRKNLVINLAKLQTGTLQTLHDESVVIDTLFPSLESPLNWEGRPRRAASLRKEAESKRKKLKSIKQFFGPVVETVPTPEPQDDDEIPVVHFRLRGKRQKVVYYDPTTDMLLARREAGLEIRAAEDDFHQQRNIADSEEKAKDLQPRFFLSNKQRIFARVQGTMGLSCLHAIQQAYKDREKAEKRVAKMEYVLAMREERDTAKGRIKMYQDDKRKRALKERESDQRKVLDVLEKQELQRLNTIERCTEIRHRSMSCSKYRRGERTFIHDFSAQNTSVSNALLRHDRQARQEDKSNEKQEIISQHRDNQQDQQQVVKKYMEHRQLMRQTESAMARAALDTRMLQEANDRMMQAKQRVAQKKACSAKVETFYPLPTLTSHTLPPVSEEQVRAMRGLDRWHTNAVMATGRVGRHNTTVTM